MFEKSLTDLIRGIRANKKNEEKYIATCLDEIRNEVRKNDADVKAVAVQKLVYLHMQGYDMSWASFHVIEVMSSPKIQYKRIGYHAAAVSFKQDTDVLMLCTNLIKKDLSSNDYRETALALHGLASIVTPDLGRDLSPDLIAMMNHSRPYIRKRVALVLYRVFLKYSDALRMAYPRLKEKLEDPDPSVVSAVVNVICELARRNPKSYLPLAPQLYGLLTNSTNNWMLIKIIKLFAALTPIEPRLTKKLVPQITNLIQSTSAMSLLYECIQTVIVGGMISPETEDGENEAHDEALARLCTAKLKIFIADHDQNLKYLGLYALSKLLAVRPKAVVEHRDTILECLDDADVSIRMRALDIVTGMVTPTNLVQIVRKLMTQLLPADSQSPTSSYPPPSLVSILDTSDRAEIINRILSICSKDTYANITNFEWYISILVDLVRVKGVDVGNLLAAQLVDVAVRVAEVRQYAVAAVVKLLEDDILLGSASQDVNNCGVLWAAAWIVGEFRMFVEEPADVLDRLLASGVTRLAPTVQAVFLQNVLKLYGHWAASETTSQQALSEQTRRILQNLEKFKLSSDLEVQERACEVYEILNLIHLDGPATDVLEEVNALFAGELNPVAPKAQKRVPIPEGLDLDQWICEPEPEPVVEESEEEESGFWNEESNRKEEFVEDPAEAERRRQERAELRKHDPFYIPPTSAARPIYDDIPISDIPIVRLEIGEPATKTSKSKKQKKSKRAASPPPPEARSYNINRGGEMPGGSGTAVSEDEREEPAIDEVTKALISVDLTAPDEGSAGVVIPPVGTEVGVVRKKIKGKEKANDEAKDGRVVQKKKKKKDGEGTKKAKKGEGEKVKKSKKVKKPVSISEQGAESAQGPSLLEQTNANKNLLAVRGVVMDAPYERLGSPAPERTSSDNRQAEPIVENGGSSDETSNWIGIGDNEQVSVAYTWQTIPAESEESIPIQLVFGFKNLTDKEMSLGEVTLTSENDAHASAAIVVSTLPPSDTQTSQTTISTPHLAPLTPAQTLHLRSSVFDIQFTVPITLNLIPPIPPLQPPEFASLLSNPDYFQHTSSTQVVVRSSRIPTGQNPHSYIFESISRWTKLSIVEVAGEACTMVARVRGDGWCAGLCKTKVRQGGGWIVSMEVRSGQREVGEGVVGEVAEWGVSL